VRQIVTLGEVRAVYITRYVFATYNVYRSDVIGGMDGTRTRDLLRDREAL
jgi:hypothetical protein